MFRYHSQLLRMMFVVIQHIRKDRRIFVHGLFPMRMLIMLMIMHVFMLVSVIMAAAAMAVILIRYVH